MCTGFTIQTLNNQVLLGRTMDYDYPLDGSPAVTPRNYRWKSRTGDRPNAIWLYWHRNRYGRFYLW